MTQESTNEIFRRLEGSNNRRALLPLIDVQIEVHTQPASRILDRTFARFDDDLWLGCVLFPRHADKDARAEELAQEFTKAYAERIKDVRQHYRAEIDQWQTKLEDLGVTSQPYVHAPRVFQAAVKSPWANQYLQLVALLDEAIRVRQAAWLNGLLDDVTHRGKIESLEDGDRRLQKLLWREGSKAREFCRHAINTLRRQQQVRSSMSEDERKANDERNGRIDQTEIEAVAQSELDAEIETPTANLVDLPDAKVATA